MNKYGLILGILFIACACSSTEQVVLQTMEPSPVALPNAIKKIGIIDRSAPSEALTIENRVDQYLAAENRWLSEKGTNAAMTGLFDELLKDSRFDSVKLLDDVPAEMKEFSLEADSISWRSVEALCSAYEVDAIFSLAYYDTDTKVSLKKASVLQTDLLRQKVKVKGQEITLETLIENGWRIYDPVNRRIIDEIVFNDQIISTGKGVDPLQAYQSIGDRREVILTKSRNTGSNYGLRLLPYESSVSRRYYARGTENFVKASELVVSGDWLGAGKLWEQEVQNRDPKIQGRSCHNLAVLSERNEDLEKAAHWANEALDYHYNKITSDYLDVLKKRAAQKDLLQQQLTQLQFSR
ncbi:MAG: DUF6340 family protein [Aurantibacter sp.]